MCLWSSTDSVYASPALCNAGACPIRVECVVWPRVSSGGLVQTRDQGAASSGGGTPQIRSWGCDRGARRPTVGRRVERERR